MSSVSRDRSILSEDNNEISKWNQLQKLFNTVNHIFIGLIVLYMFTLSYSLNFIDTSLHALFAVTGFHLFAAEAIMCYYPENRLTNSFSQKTRTRIHTFLQIIGGSLGLLAAVGKFSKTEIHFTTIHGKMGLLTATLCFCSMMGGFVNLFSQTFRSVIKPAAIKLGHNILGLLTFLSAMSTIFFGYRTGFFDKYVNSELVPIISSITIFVAIFSSLGAFKSLFSKLLTRKIK